MQIATGEYQNSLMVDYSMIVSFAVRAYWNRCVYNAVLEKLKTFDTNPCLPHTAFEVLKLRTDKGKRRAANASKTKINVLNHKCHELRGFLMLLPDMPRILLGYIATQNHILCPNSLS